MKKYIGMKFILVFSIFVFAFLAYQPDTATYASDTHPVMSSSPDVYTNVQAEHASFSQLSPGPLASKIDNTSKFPTPKDQGIYGDCTAWAVAYAYKTMQDNIDHGWGLTSTSTQFSPFYVYNQLNGGNTSKGISIKKAMSLLISQGCCTLKDMPSISSPLLNAGIGVYGNVPPPVEYLHRASSQSALIGTNDFKSAITTTGGAVMAIPVYNDFDTLSSSNQTYDTISGTCRGWHSICLVGYDDANKRFKFINSWGTGWGLSGYGYISYSLVDNSKYSIYGYSMTDFSESAPPSAPSIYGITSTTVKLNQQTSGFPLEVVIRTSAGALVPGCPTDFVQTYMFYGLQPYTNYAVSQRRAAIGNIPASNYSAWTYFITAR